RTSVLLTDRDRPDIAQPSRRSRRRWGLFPRTVRMRQIRSLLAAHVVAAVWLSMALGQTPPKVAITEIIETTADGKYSSKITEPAPQFWPQTQQPTVKFGAPAPAATATLTVDSSEPTAAAGGSGSWQVQLSALAAGPHVVVAKA